jgi:hypothetical protein
LIQAPQDNGRIAMAYKFKYENRNWTEYRKLPNTVEIDFHMTPDDPDFGLPYWEKMEKVWNYSLKALQRAQAEGMQYILLIHGLSTSRIGRTTSRSQIRKLMHSKEATPYIIRKNCIEHNTIFVAAIKSL